MHEFRNWKSIPGHNEEKYALYLCSSEWGAKRRAVRERSNGVCERCKRSQAKQCHHMTYQRRYMEPLTDLMDVCKGCHDYIHGHSQADPASQPDAADTGIVIGGVVCCPNCRTEHDNVHIMGLRVVQNDLSTTVSGAGVKQKEIAAEHRDGSDLAIQYVCECGTRFEWQMRFHHGRVLFEIQARGFPIIDDELWRD